MGSFKELLVWQKSMELATDIHKVTMDFPSEEKIGLVSQIRNAATSISSNIMEGNSKNNAADYMQHIKIASGKITRLETLLIISENLELISKEKYAELLSKITEVSKILRDLLHYLKTIK